MMVKRLVGFSLAVTLLSLLSVAPAAAHVAVGHLVLGQGRIEDNGEVMRTFRLAGEKTENGIEVGRLRFEKSSNNQQDLLLDGRINSLKFNVTATGWVADFQGTAWVRMNGQWAPNYTIKGSAYDSSAGDQLSLIYCNTITSMCTTYLNPNLTAGWIEIK